MAVSIAASSARRRTMYHASTRDMGRSENFPVLPMAEQHFVSAVNDNLGLEK
jgi:hypothetical protein